MATMITMTSESKKSHTRMKRMKKKRTMYIISFFSLSYFRIRLEGDSVSLFSESTILATSKFYNQKRSHMILIKHQLFKYGGRNENKHTMRLILS